ncbi:hypothetical protein [Reichenbachiella sp.]|uniref:RHS repeat protein n=1 Tax=Reichenbachiella sp. TaxID=2184521 RepID=UPI0032983CA2
MPTLFRMNIMNMQSIKIFLFALLVLLFFDNQISFAQGPAAPPGGGGGTPPSAPSTSFNQSYNCNSTVVSRTSSAPAGIVWYWQTSSSGTSKSYQGSSYTVTSSRTVYLRSFAPLNNLWGSYKSVYVTVNPNTLSGGNTSGAKTICYGASAGTLGNSSSASGGLSSYSYQWQVSSNNSSWSNISGATGTSYSPGNLTATRYYRRRVISCGKTVYAASEKVTVRSSLSSGSINGAKTICYGASAGTLGNSSSASGGNGSYSYQWQISTNNSSWSNISGATGTSYSPGNLTSNRYYRRRVYSCSQYKYTSSQKITVYSNLTAGSISNAQTLCYNGDPGTLTNTASASGGTSRVYQWQKSTSGSTSGFSNISGATGSTYNPPALTQSTWYRRRVTSGSGCGTKYTNVIKVSIHGNLTSGSIGNAQTLCYNSNPGALTNTASASGGTSNTYQWQMSATSSSSGFSDINAATGSTYDPSALTQTTWYRRKVTSGSGCGTQYTAAVAITIYDDLSAGSIGNAQSLCNLDDPTALTSTASATGGTAITYQWQQSTTDASNGFTDIGGATGETYDPSSLSQTTWYRRKATSGAGCGSEITPVVEISIAVTLDAGTISGTQSICDRDLPNDLTGSAPSGGMGAFTYQWESSTDQASWSPVVGETTADLSFSSFTQSAYYRRSVSNGCGTDVSNEVLVTFVPLPDPGTIAGAQDLCVGISPTEMTGTDQPGVTYQWQSSVDGSTWEDVAGATQQSYLPPTATLYYRRVSTENNCEAYSNTVLINIRTTPVDAGSNQILMNDQGLMVLTGSPAGGTWSGTGVSTDNFDPDVAGIGTHELTYTYTDGHCVKEDQRTITVNFNNITVGFMEDFAFQYRYDERQRMVMKQVPGADSVEMIYDKRDRLVLTRDGNQRAGGEWSFTKYDQLNRPVLTGIIEDSRNRAAIESEINAQTGSDFYESYTGTGALMGYDGSGYPSAATAADLMTVTYYDNYQFSDGNHWTLGDYTGASQVKTLVTGTKVSVPGLGWNESATFYDSRNRMTDTVSKDYQGNYDSLVNEYYSLLHPLVVKTTHYHESALTQTSDTITMDYAHDHGDRLMSVTHQINNETPVVIVENEYNELGELTTKKLNKVGTGQYAQEIDYAYNIRGWLTKINDPSASDPTRYFAMQLKYDDAGQYNGNIGATNWKNPFEAAVNSYNYSYDPVNRIKSADYSSTVGAADFDVNNISYDANGNILTLQRTGDHDDQVAELFDDLDYDYVGNQLTKVTDASGKDTGFKDGVNTSEEYVYDANGNMISDANKGIEKIEYNHLNLPIKVEMNADGSDRIEYIYDAAGIKMAQIVYEGGVETKRTDYQGAFIYESKDGEASALQFIQHDEGRVVHHPEPVPGSQTFDYQYHLKDHLGNVRTTFKTTDDVDVSLATFESGQTATEAEYFSGYDGMTKITADLFNHTSGGNTSIRLNGSANETEGIGKSLKVKPGDVIDMEVYAKYFNASNSAGWGNLLTTLVANIADPASGLASEGGGIGADAFPFADWTGKANPSSAPKAYMNYMVFDQNYGLLHQGYQQISTAAEENGSDVAHEKLSHSLTATEAGYVYIYLSNEEGTPIDVFFDDFTVTQHHTPIVSKDDYYPFGLTFNSYSRATSTPNKWKFQGQEHVDALGVNWDSFKWRNHQPDIGRFFNIDPLSEKFYYNSPYAFSENKVTSHIELEGLEAFDIKYGSAERRFLKGKINESQLMNTYRGSAKGGAIGTAVVATYFGGAALVPYAGSTYNSAVLGANTYGAELVGLVAGLFGYDAEIPGTGGDNIGKLLRTGADNALSYFMKSGSGDEIWTGSAQLVDDVLELDFNVPDGMKKQGIGTTMFNDALSAFGDDVQGIKGQWLDGDNLKAFNEALQGGASSGDAAFSTATGKWAQKNGFTNVEWVNSKINDDGAVESLELIFRK